MFSLNEKRALMTGAGSGIGAAIATAFAQAGVGAIYKSPLGAPKVGEHNAAIREELS